MYSSAHVCILSVDVYDYREQISASTERSNNHPQILAALKWTKIGGRAAIIIRFFPANFLTAYTVCYIICTVWDGKCRQLCMKIVGRTAIIICYFPANFPATHTVCYNVRTVWDGKFRQLCWPMQIKVCSHCQHNALAAFHDMVVMELHLMKIFPQIHGNNPGPFHSQGLRKQKWSGAVQIPKLWSLLYISY